MLISSSHIPHLLPPQHRKVPFSYGTQGADAFLTASLPNYSQKQPTESPNQAGGAAAETSSAVRPLLHHVRTLHMEKQLKITPKSHNQTHKTWILLPPQLIHGYWGRHLFYTSKSLQAAFAGSCLGLKTSITFPVQPQGTKKNSAIGMKSSNAQVMVSSCRNTPWRASHKVMKQSPCQCRSSRKVFPLPPSHLAGSKDALRIQSVGVLRIK